MQLATLSPGTIGQSGHSGPPWLLLLIWTALIVVLVLIVSTLLLQSLRSALGRIRADR